MGSGWKGRMAGSWLEGLEGWSWKGSGWKVGRRLPKQEPAQYHFTKEGWRAGRLEGRGLEELEGWGGWRAGEFQW